MSLQAIGSVGCPQDNGTAGIIVTSEVDKWLCSDPCTDSSPCLWNLTADPFERTNLAATFPHVVATMKARLLALSLNFTQNEPLVGSNAVFCALAQKRGNFLGPWINASDVAADLADIGANRRGPGAVSAAREPLATRSG
jgi:hypothetical protein